MDFETILDDVDGAIAIITVNELVRPEEAGGRSNAHDVGDAS